MPFDLDNPKKQTIALLGLAVRDASTTVPEYTTSLGDTTYATAEITRAGQNAVTEIMKAICETDGHPDRALFTSAQPLTHEGQLPAHLGSIGVPRITPFSGAAYTITGKRKSIEEVAAYRHNPNNLYSLTAHNASSGGMHSKLAGFYAIDGQTGYFTGYSAVSDVANFVEADYTLLPDRYYPLASFLQIGFLKKDGDISDIFDHYIKLGAIGLDAIRKGEMDQPSIKKTVGARDSGSK